MEENEILTEKGLALTYNNCETEFGAVPALTIKETEAFIDGHHWFGGQGWVGWRPESLSKSASATWAFIQNAFTPKNVIGGMSNRLKGAIAGQQPDFAVTPKDKDTATPEELETYAQMDRALNDWFTSKDVHEEIKKFVHNRKAHGKASLRIHVPIGLLQKQGDTYTVPANNFTSALDFIYVTAHDADKFTDGKDVNFGEKYTIVKLGGNVNPSDNSMDEFQYEISFVDKEKKTILRTVNRDPKRDRTIKLDLGGNPLCLVKGDYKEAMFNYPMKQMQKRVNCAKTHEGLAGDNINFPETTFVDLELPKEAVLQPNGKSKETEVNISGMGTWKKLLSRWGTDADGGDRPAQGQVITRPQADPEFFNRIANNNTRDMHQQGGMLYIYLADSEYASGDAKIEAMADYLILLVDSATELDTVGAWLGKTVTRLAMRFAGDEALRDKFSFIYKSKLTLGKLTVEERRLMLDEVKGMLRSPRSYQVVAGISDDPEKEQMTIDEYFNSLDDDQKQIMYALVKKEVVPPKATGAGGGA